VLFSAQVKSRVILWVHGNLERCARVSGQIYFTRFSLAARAALRCLKYC